MRLPIASVPANQQRGRHPDVRSIDQGLPATNTIRLSGPQGPTGLRLGPASATIGVESGADHLLFNRINGVAITRAGHIVIWTPSSANYACLTDRGSSSSASDALVMGRVSSEIRQRWS